MSARTSRRRRARFFASSPRPSTKRSSGSTACSPALSKSFKQADKSGDGKLSRAEYLRAMTAQDLGTAKKKVAKAVDRKDDKRSAAAGGTKEDKIGKDANDPGFNALDKNNDG